VVKHSITTPSEAGKGNAATFLSKIEGVVEGLFEDMIATHNPEAKVSHMLSPLTSPFLRPMRCLLAIVFRVGIYFKSLGLVPIPSPLYSDDLLYDFRSALETFYYMPSCSCQ
jgi:hypothetical protein